MPDAGRVLRWWEHRRVIVTRPRSRQPRGANHARRQQYRRLSRAGRLGLTSIVAAIFGLFAVRIGAALPGALFLTIAVVLGLRARHWLSLAQRSRVGALSEDQVRRALEPLRERGWRLRHGLRWRGGGDIDSVAVAPNGVGFAIETKTRTYDERQLGRVARRSSAEVVPPRSARRPMRGARGRNGAARARCAGGLDRPTRPGDARSRR